jgi:hypothetical protein
VSAAATDSIRRDVAKHARALASPSTTPRESIFLVVCTVLVWMRKNSATPWKSRKRLASGRGRQP